METIELSGIIGLIAITCLAANLIVGFIIWKNIQIKLPYHLTLLNLHKLTGYSAAIAILVHVVLIPLDPKSKFTWTDLLLPLWTEHQPYANTFGALAFYLIAIVVTSSYFKDKMRLPLWRTLHYLSYFAAVPLVVHSVWTDPKLEDRPIDWFDAEKVFVLLCCLVIVALTAYRFLIIRKRSSSD
ncbi:MAG TPA: ferric reductase-like transmembrane domain-containing protein [Cyclobacteriaceae bacterium]|nr:ferric reductase-like transmembrane domain-containing protein [Cyclobacteriaceae bacterium]